MPATFAHAISSTRPTIAISPAAPIDSMPPACGTSSRTSSVGTADILLILVGLQVGRFELAADQRDVGVGLLPP